MQIAAVHRAEADAGDEPLHIIHLSECITQFILQVNLRFEFFNGIEARLYLHG